MGQRTWNEGERLLVCWFAGSSAVGLMHHVPRHVDELQRTYTTDEQSMREKIPCTSIVT